MRRTAGEIVATLLIVALALASSSWGFVRPSAADFASAESAFATGQAPVADATDVADAESTDPALPDSDIYFPVVRNMASELAYADNGHTDLGDWRAEVRVSESQWQPNTPLTIEATLLISDTHLSALASVGVTVTHFTLLVTAERTFDAEGWQRLGSDEKMSTLLTPTGLAIEGGNPGAVTNRFGYDFKTPIDEYITLAITETEKTATGRKVRFTLQTLVPNDVPPGLYRLRLDFGVKNKTRLTNLNAESFAVKPFFKTLPTASYLYSPLIPCSGEHVSGLSVHANAIRPRVPWLLLANYNSNGYRGVVANEDDHHFATSDRNIIPDEVILPLYSDRGITLTYSLEPTFPTDGIDQRAAIPWDYTKGELSVRVTAPNGQVTDLGSAPFVAKNGLGATTKKSAFTAWKPTMYGRHKVECQGWLQDIYGRRYYGGGTYEFWIAKRMTMATATFQGMPYPVGSRYGRDIGFAPAVPAAVTVTATLYPYSDAVNPKSLTYSGQASPGGIYGSAQGSKPFILDTPGEYHASILATYVDSDKHLWVCSMRHAGVVYALDTPVIAHGKKLYLKGKYVDRGETHDEGYVEGNVSHLNHINYPWLANDVLLIASEFEGANKIEPVMTYEISGTVTPYDPRLRGVGTSNLAIKTSNGLSPHMFPEYITELQYYYSGAPRPGFMSRFLVGDSIVRAPYWPTSPNAFGSQIGASNNGDFPGDIYRLLGGVVLRPQGVQAQYAGYIASAFILPQGSNNNRVVAPGSEDMFGSDGQLGRVFLVSTRPGMAYEVGSNFTPVAQIDPILPVAVHAELSYPDGRVQIADGVGDAFGSFAGKTPWLLDIPGVYRLRINAEWQGFQGRMPGLPAEGGDIYVYERERPAGGNTLKLNPPAQTVFSPTAGLTLTGITTADVVHYAAVIPGAVIAQGTVPVSNGRFSYFFDPAEIHSRIPTYDIENEVNGKPEIGRVVHLTFFAAERSPDGSVHHDFARVILRGTTVVLTQ